MQSGNNFGRSDVTQESQYTFPYHYIASFENGHFCQHLYWSWGFRYLGGLELVLSILGEEPFESLIDIGCGDGRFLREVSNKFAESALIGIDNSPRAIDLARAMNPALSFECIDICSQRAAMGTFDVVTLVEVLEHIPVESVDDFLSAIASYQELGGRLVLTTPHKNKPVQVKHYQHFDGAALRKLLEPHYEVERMVFFDKMTRIFNRLMSSFLGNSLFILNNHFLLDILFNIYRKHFLICSEARCGRICLVGRKK